MSLSAAVIESFERSFGLYRDLAASLDSKALASDLPDLPSNSLGAQLWCVVGSRESYARAIEAGGWAGFSCSLDDAADPAEVAAALGRSAGAVRTVLGHGELELDDTRTRLLVDLLEHEAQHHGQVIRYLYALRLAVPDSWKSRYALD